MEVFSTRAHRPTLEYHPTIDELTYEWLLICTAGYMSGLRWSAVALPRAERTAVADRKQNFKPPRSTRPCTAAGNTVGVELLK